MNVATMSRQTKRAYLRLCPEKRRENFRMKRVETAIANFLASINTVETFFKIKMQLFLLLVCRISGMLRLKEKTPEKLK